MSLGNLILAFLVSLHTVIADDAAIEMVSAGHAQRQSMIVSMETTFEVRGVRLDSGEKSDEIEVVYWAAKDGNWRRRRNELDMELEPGLIYDGPLDSAAMDGVSTTLRKTIDTAGTWDPQATITHATAEPVGFADFQSRTMNIVQEKPLITVTDALNNRSRITNCERAEDGTYLLTYNVEPGHDVVVTFDPDRNFLITRSATTYRDNPNFAGFSQDLIEAKEVKPGIWVATIVDMKLYERDGKGDKVEPVAASRFSVREIKINEPLPEDIFSLELPEGTEVSNEVTGKLYFWGKGQRASEEMPLPELQSPPQFVVGPIDEQMRSTRWLLIFVNIMVIGIVVCYLLIRRRPRTPESASTSNEQE